MTNASACSPSGFASLSIHNVPCPPTHLGSVCPKRRGAANAAGEPQQYQPICPCPQASVPVLHRLTIDDHADKRGGKCPSNGHLYPRPTLTSLQVHGCFSVSLFIAVCLLSVAPTAPTSPPHQPPAHTHTWWQTRWKLLLQGQTIWVHHQYYQRFCFSPL